MIIVWVIVFIFCNFMIIIWIIVFHLKESFGSVCVKHIMHVSNQHGLELSLFRIDSERPTYHAYDETGDLDLDQISVA
jgi:hypothetical protein